VHLERPGGRGVIRAAQLKTCSDSTAFRDLAERPPFYLPMTTVQMEPPRQREETTMSARTLVRGGGA
jgi:hypothetical protein